MEITATVIAVVVIIIIIIIIVIVVSNNRTKKAPPPPTKCTTSCVPGICINGACTSTCIVGATGGCDPTAYCTGAAGSTAGSTGTCVLRPLPPTPTPSPSPSPSPTGCTTSCAPGICINGACTSTCIVGATGGCDPTAYCTGATGSTAGSTGTCVLRPPPCICNTACSPWICDTTLCSCTTTCGGNSDCDASAYCSTAATGTGTCVLNNSIFEYMQFFTLNNNDYKVFATLAAGPAMVLNGTISFNLTMSNSCTIGIGITAASTTISSQTFTMVDNITIPVTINVNSSIAASTTPINFTFSYAAVNDACYQAGLLVTDFMCNLTYTLDTSDTYTLDKPDFLDFYEWHPQML